MKSLAIFMLAVLYGMHIMAHIEFTIIQDWKLLDHPYSSSRYINSWIVPCRIEIKKKAIEQTIFINTIAFSLNDLSDKTVHASLYKKPMQHDFLPFQENLLAESTLDTKNKRLVFRLANPLMLEVSTTLYIVLSIPSALVPTIKTLRSAC